jgi:hypothetical protein
MGTKLNKDTYPAGHGPNDFEVNGPPATKDGEFQHAKIADFGCFKQGETDSNKYYCSQICQSTKTKKWFVYFEWGRVGASKPSFQFVECSSESDAQEEFIDQCRAKNDKRGQWGQVGGLRVLQPKPGKDCYLVRPMATRSCGLPDGRKIKLNDGAKQAAAPVAKTATATTAPARKTDPHTLALMRDLNVGTVKYAKGAVVGNALPSQSAIDEARTLLTEAEKRVLAIGGNVDQQVADKELVDITSILYSRIPKVKPVRAAASTWILSSDNIFNWRNDLDAFESALYSSSMADATDTSDPFDGMRLDMEWVNPMTPLGKFLYGWWPNATGNRHGHVGKMRIRNMWKVSRHDDAGKIEKWKQRVLADGSPVCDRPLYQPNERFDVEDAKLRKIFHDTNTFLGFHGTRSVNVSGILRLALRLPKQLVGVVITGAMFGPGIYWADDWKKSDGYTSRSGSYYASSGGAIAGRGAFMFSADVVAGNPYVAPHSGGYTSPPPGPRGAKTHCVFGKMGHSGVANNEWIIYDNTQNVLRYLIEYDCN